MGKKKADKHTLDGCKTVPQKKRYTLTLTIKEREYLLNFLQAAYDASTNLLELTVIKQIMERLDCFIDDFVPPLSMLKQAEGFEIDKE